ncbi:unnamed protein product [Triticum turgidum subsp. durum]|uniref:non-specific serine/threonine protein kinase n=3 Tax=Triticum turgidum subsp. durum TaxID=4567 RepID=A0A9R1BEU5_TRITD|nr:unnamed protein product [Triticum turgidum subsp. durum]
MASSFSCSERTKLTWMLALLLILVMMLRVDGQSGFLSVDCGWTDSAGSTYNDSATGLPYDSDGKFMEGGLSSKISAEFIADAGNEQQKTLRSFPDGKRNCYTLPSAIGKKFLLRAMFSYGNYDGLNRSMDGSPFIFGLHIGVNFWETVNLTNLDPSLTLWKEVLTMAPANLLSFCLINLGSGTPFVSSLELRPLGDAMYPFLSTYVSVSYLRRFRFGDAAEYITRYPVDNYDRFWEGWSFSFNTYPWISLNTSRPVNRLNSIDVFQVPEVILQKATTLDTNYSFMEVSVEVGSNLDIRGMELLPIFHFTEIAGDIPNRTFNVYSADELLFQDVSLSPMRVESMYPTNRFLTNRFLSGSNTTSFMLRKVPGSKLPPLINALEVYSIVRTDNLTTSSEDVNYMKEVKKHYNLGRNWNGDPCSPREYTWEGLTCDYSNGNQNPRIVRVNMSTSKLRGVLAISFFMMASLENLDLSHNNLTGTIPNYELKSLKVLNLSYNQLDGPIPNSIVQRFQAGLLDLRLEGNPICSKGKYMYCSNTKNSKHVMLTAVIVPVVLVSLLVVLGVLWKVCQKGNSGDHEDYDIYEEETPLHIDIRRFTYVELKFITKDFQSIIGKGGFGTVYHGILENGDEVAVKVLMETSIAESTDFLPEVQTLSKVHHKNLVTLAGYCQNKKCLALVYDFMSRGNLQQILRGGHDYTLNWEQRLYIALDAAQGLEYLHESCTPSVVHRDVKTPNILLDKNLVGIISDFGLSRAFNDAHTHISTVAAGTLGYLDPEYHATFQLTVKTDVYSFGIVLLEIITGQPPVLVNPQTIHLPNWIRQKIATGSIHDVVDKRLLDQYDASSLQSVVDLAMMCVENATIDRPTMTEVVSRLKACLPEVPRLLQPTISGVPPISSEGDFQFDYTGRMSNTSLLSGR